MNILLLMYNIFFAEGMPWRINGLREKLMTTNLQSTKKIQLTFNELLIPDGGTSR